MIKISIVFASLVVGKKTNSNNLTFTSLLSATYGGGEDFSSSSTTPGLSFGRCQFKVSLPSITDDKKLQFAVFVKGNEFGGFNALMTALLSTFDEDITSPWFIEFIEFELDHASDLSYCSINLLPISFTVI